MKETIKAVAKAHGLTLKDIATRMEIYPQTLQTYLNGNMTVKTLHRIADAIGCSVADFFPTQSTPQLKCPHCGSALHIELH